MNIKKRLMKSVFFQTYARIIKERKLFAYVILTDIAFVVGLLVLKSVFDSLSTRIIPSAATVIALVILYYLGLTLAYSACKFMILHFVQSSFSKQKYRSNRLGSFFVLNILLAIVLLGVLILLSVIASKTRPGAAPFVSLAFLALWTALTYLVVNAAHVAFALGNGIKKSLFSGWGFVAQVKHYYGLLVVKLVMIALIVAILSVFGKTLQIVGIQDYTQLLQFANIYTVIFIHAVGIVFWLSIVFNRFYFFEIVNKKNV